MSVKFILVSGGVMSGVGKGITASSVGLLMKQSGMKVNMIKIDPYVNIDAGLFSPYEHGEVFVLEDGGEADLDLGSYERWLDLNLTRDNNITTGKVYQSVIEKERKGGYLGKTVQVVPHITDCIQDKILNVAMGRKEDGLIDPCDVCVIELGGTVGDIESMPFLEALRQLRYKVGASNFVNIYVSLVPVTGDGEQKTKPIQHGVRECMNAGLPPSFLACRCSIPVSDNTKSKLAMTCEIPVEHIFSVHDVPNIYHVPLLLAEQLAHVAFVKALALNNLLSSRLKPLDLKDWRRLAATVDDLREEVNIAIVGKYTGLTDAYLSLMKALQHAGYQADRKIVISWIESDDLGEGNELRDSEAWKKLKAADGVLVPGGFGERGAEGKMRAISYARTQRVPYLGICYGMQLAVIEYARNVLEEKQADSEEFEAGGAGPHFVVYMPEIDRGQLGGNMRLGGRTTYFRQDIPSLLSPFYQNAPSFSARHRHRYEVNPEYVERLEAAGLMFTGKDESGVRMEVLELREDVHPFFVGLQAHPEYTSRPNKPSPPFVGLIQAAIQHRQSLGTSASTAC